MILDGFLFPNDPTDVQVSFLRNIEVKTAYADACTVTDLGAEGRVFDCEGVFFGTNCYTSCKTLINIFNEGKKVTFTHPQWGEAQVLMTRLEVIEQCKPNFTRYRMRLVEAP